MVYHICESILHGLEVFLELAVPFIAAVAEIIGLLIIVLSLARATYHYFSAMLFHDDHDFHHEMSSGLTTALEFLMAAEVAKTVLLPTLSSVLLLAATFGLRALMSLLLHAEMRTARAEKAEANRAASRAEKRAKRLAEREDSAEKDAEAENEVEA